MSKGVELIANERKRQIEELGYDYTNDSLYGNNELARAGATYAMPEGHLRGAYYLGKPRTWPWDWEFWKPSPKDRIKELTKAGALIAAQIDYELNKV